MAAFNPSVIGVQANYPSSGNPYPTSYSVNGVTVDAPAPPHGALVPEHWYPFTLIEFYNSTVLTYITNTDYEGVIRQFGDTVRVRERPHFSIKPLKIGTTIQYETKVPNQQALVINRANYWGTQDDDLVNRQSDVNYMMDWCAGAGMDMAVETDKMVVQGLVTDPHSKNMGKAAGAQSGHYDMGTAASPRIITKSNVIDFCVDASAVLDEQNVPKMGRWMVLPPVIEAIVRKSDLKDASLSGDETSLVRRNDYLGTVSGFTLFGSLQQATGNTNAGNPDNIMYHKCLFGHNKAVAFATQIDKIEGPIRDKDHFGDLYRGHNLWGYRTMKPQALGMAILGPGD